MKKLLLVLTISIVTNAFAQQNISFQKGQKYHVTTEIKKNSIIDVISEKFETNIHAFLDEVYHLNDVNGDGVIIEHNIVRLRYDTDGFQKETFDSDKPSDQTDELGMTVQTAIKNKNTYLVASSGTLKTVKLDNEKIIKDNETAASISFLTLQTGLNLLVPNEGENLWLKVLPSDQFKIGDKFTFSYSNSVGKTAIEYKVTGISGADVLLDYNDFSIINSKSILMGVEAQFNGTNKSAGKAIADKQTGMLKSLTSNMITDIKVDVNGMISSITEKATKTVTVK